MFDFQKKHSYFLLTYHFLKFKINILDKNKSFWSKKKKKKSQKHTKFNFSYCLFFLDT